MEPTLMTAILALIGSLFFAAIALAVGLYFLRDAWAHRGGHLKNRYAYGSQDSCEIKFVRGGYGK